MLKIEINHCKTNVHLIYFYLYIHFYKWKYIFVDVFALYFSLNSNHLKFKYCVKFHDSMKVLDFSYVFFVCFKRILFKFITRVHLPHSCLRWLNPQTTAYAGLVSLKLRKCGDASSMNQRVERDGKTQVIISLIARFLITSKVKGISIGGSTSQMRAIL